MVVNHINDPRQFPVSSLQNVTITFDRNTAASAGDAIYSTDFNYCRFLGDANTSDFPYNASIFNLPPGYQSPFVYMWVMQESQHLYMLMCVVCNVRSTHVHV